MTIVANSFNHDLITKYLSETDAKKAQVLASTKDTNHIYVTMYSWKENIWLVAMTDSHGNIYGYIHPILE